MSRIDPGEQFERALRERRASVQIDGQTWVKVPPGSLLMPRVATSDMIAAADRIAATGEGSYADIYRAMVGARPTIPV